MSYTLLHTNGTSLTTVTDGSIDTTTDLVFVGKNYSNYGQLINQDLVKLLENFAGPTQPTKPLVGEIWYDSGNGKIKFYTGKRFKATASIESGSVFPTDMTPADLFWDGQRLNLYDGFTNSWQVVGPQYTTAQLTNNVIYNNVIDNQGFYHNILQHQLLNSSNDLVTVAITSPDSFTLGSANPIAGFSTIYQGMTINGTDPVTGIGSTSSFTIWGTVSNATKVGGYSADQLVLYSNPTATGQLFISGSASSINLNSITLIQNQSSSTNIINTNAGGRVSISALNKNNSGSPVDIASFDATEMAIIPTVSLSLRTDIGSASLYPGFTTSTSQFNNLYVDTVWSPSVNSQNLAVQNIIPQINPEYPGQTSSIGTADNPFGQIYASNIIATDSFEGTILAGAAPTHSTSTGTVGQIGVDAGYFYVCVATNLWRRCELLSDTW